MNKKILKILKQANYEELAKKDSLELMIDSKEQKLIKNKHYILY